MINPKIFKAYDIRGIYPTEMDEAGAERITRAIYTFFKEKVTKPNFTVLLTRDMRLSSPSMFEAAKKALLDMGANVVDAGLLSTPSFYFAVFYYKFDTGIQVTASHNPKEYTGLKFVINTPQGLIKIGKPTGMDTIKEMSMSDTVFSNAEKPGTLSTKTGILEDEVKNALAMLHNPPLKKFKIVADPANAMAITYLEALEKVVPMELVKMNFELDGSFPVHQPDPMQAENLVDLQKRVLEEKADLGLAPDGDGDRLFFINEKGEVIPPTLITSVIIKELLKDNPGAMMLVDIRYILSSRKIIEENGGKFDMTKVGHAFITEQMTRTGAIFGGESSAHYFYKSTGNAESQVTTILTVLKILSEENKPISEVTESVRRSYESGEFNFKVTNAPEILEAIKAKYNDGEFTDMDGIAITYPGFRFNVRTSNTEPLLRLNVEAYEQAIMESKRDELLTLIKSLAKEDTTSTGH